MINIHPDETRHDPLYQIVNINLPLNPRLTVDDVFIWLLKRSGYSLCVNDHPTQFLTDRPLPLSQYRLSLIRLEDVLKALAGPGWLIQTDVLSHEVCPYLSTPGTGDHHT